MSSFVYTDGKILTTFLFWRWSSLSRLIVVKKLLGRRGQFSVEEDEKRMMLAVTDAQLPNPPPPKHTGIKVQSIGEGGSTI
mmetsp:Transcript_22154/g.47928  ORF Transcript_22154/g.47928 Transcript_22154/m.47928 type:complete len:81 (+) Transcript_22154:356-598(+)